jgi:hypothetical protein
MLAAKCLFVRNRLPAAGCSYLEDMLAVGYLGTTSRYEKVISKALPR